MLRLSGRARKNWPLRGRRPTVWCQEHADPAYGLMDELRKLEKDEPVQHVTSARPVRGRCAKKETEKLFGETDVVHAPQRTFKPLDSVKLGQEVLSSELDKPGIVTALPDRDGMVEVRAGTVQTEVAAQRPVRAAQAAARAAEEVSAAPCAVLRVRRDRVTRTPSMEINLIGMTVRRSSA